MRAGLQTFYQNLRYVVACLILLAIQWTYLFAQDTADATPVVALQGSDFHVNLAPHVLVFEDPTRQVTVGDATSDAFRSAFAPIRGRLVDLGFTRSRLWVRARVSNASGQSGIWKLTLDVPVAEEITVYLRQDGADPAPLQVLMNSNENSPFSERPDDYRNLVATLALPKDASAEVFIAFTSGQALKLPLYLESEDEFFSRIWAEDLQNWLVLALTFGVTLVSTVFLTALGFRTAGYYGAYILTSGFYIFHTDGYAFQMIWPNWPVWNNIAVAPIGMLAVATGSLFARSFVQTARFHPRLDRILLGFVAAATVLFILSFFVSTSPRFMTVAVLFSFVASGLYLTCGYVGIRRNLVGAGWFLLGAAAIALTLAITAFGYLVPGVVEQDFIAGFMRYALLFEALTFSAAIMLNIQDMRRARNRALRKQIAATEEKLRISEALAEAEREHRRVAHLAEQRRARLATTAHDIRQPLSSLQMALSRFAGNDKAFSEQVSDSLAYLDMLVETALEETRRERYATEEHSIRSGEEEFPLSVIMRNVETLFKEEAKANQVDLRFVLSSAVVRSQPLSILRIVSNLVSNAIRHSDGGRVLVGVRRAGNASRIEVHNTGRGMTQDELERVLLHYERSSDATGTGLGLALVQDLCAKARLRFALKSFPERGTIAALTIGEG